MSKFAQIDEEFVQAVRLWNEAIREEHDAVYHKDKADLRLEEAVADHKKRKQAVADLLSHNYPMVIPYGTEGKGTLYFLDEGAFGHPVLRTMDVVVVGGPRSG